MKRVTITAASPMPDDVRERSCESKKGLFSSLTIDIKIAA